MDMSYCFYMAETEGLLPTRTGKINKLIKKVIEYPSDTIDEFAFETIANSCGIDPKTLTVREWKHINSAIKHP